MGDVAVYTVLNFETALANKEDSVKRPFKFFIDPSFVLVGDIINIALYAPDQYILQSPYNGIIGGKNIDANEEVITEVINVSGGSVITTTHPVNELQSVIVAGVLVDEELRTISSSSGSNIKSSFKVVNSELSFIDENKYIGSLKVIYSTFKAQNWTHKAFSEAALAILFAENQLNKDWVSHQITVSELSVSDTDNNIQILPHEGTITNGAYHRYRIYYNGNRDFKHITDIGTSTFKGTYSGEIKHEKITLSGSLEVSAAFYIRNADIKKQGYFYDENGDSVSVSVTVSGGKLILSKKVWGQLVVSYDAFYALYDYFAEDTGDEIIGITRKTGSIFAFKKGLIASYEIPKQQFIRNESEVVLRVTSKILAVSENEGWELPPNLTAEVHDTSYPSFPESPEADISNGFSITERVHEVISLWGDTTWKDAEIKKRWLQPFIGHDDFGDIKYYLRDDTESITDNYARQEAQKERDRLKVEYQIV